MSDGVVSGTVTANNAPVTDANAASVTNLLHFDGNATNSVGGSTLPTS